ncbi:RepB family plasmid replication initiator protein [Noviherbaspirillum cavernae]|uniref:RepB family plasmid replication initiator protein n=1 Tax=Noviherbaspirillum cavernae TaxID=2320862 RepID=A0A418WW55_9BURK|nr:replication initiation protein [Noviherbaspirillum cavernae]RJF96868.1 RepB family plasmid replication initiator protein [Noviherbaspirillum cavernae]
MPETKKPNRVVSAGKKEVRAEPDFPLRKPVNTLAIVPKSEKITVTARKIYNVMLHYAQRQGVAKDRYQVRLADIATGIDFNSNNTELIKQYFRQMATTGVEWQSPTTGEGARWSVSALIAHADLIQREGELILEWSYAPNIKQELLDPQRFARMSLQVQASLNTMASLVLYEICCRYADNPGGLTARQPWAWWRPVLTGAPDSPTSAYLEYKIFNRDVLKKAVKKVNEVSDLEIELVEHRAGRSIQDLQFRVRRKAPMLPQTEKAIEPVDLKTIGAAIKAGIPQDRAEKHLLKYGAKALDDALRVMNERKGRVNMEPVRSPEKYLLTLLQSGQFGEQQPSAPAPRKVFDTKAERLKLIEQFMAQKRGELNEMFHEMPDDDQQAWIVRFEAEALPASEVVRKAFRTKGIASQIVRPLFFKFLGNAVWEEGWDKPTDSDLVDLAILTKEEGRGEHAPAVGKLRL